MRDLKALDDYFARQEQPHVSEGFTDVIAVRHVVENTVSEKHKRYFSQWTN